MIKFKRLTKRKTLEEFIRDSINFHGYRYDYNKSVYINNKTPLIIICPIHGKFNQKPLNHLQGHGCPYCNGKKVCNENCLATTHPELLKEWHPTLNLSLTPFNITYGSSKKVWWKCPKSDDHVWEANIGSRAKGFGCPCCRGLKVVKSNCLATTHPEIIKEWNHNKNKLMPFEVIYGSGIRVWWICKKGHEWQATINKRTSGRKCPFCCNQKICKDNCLATLNPELAKEWHSTKNGNLKSENVTANTNKKVWWICKNGHEWSAAISNRNRGSGCPSCNEDSKGSKKIKEILIKLNINYNIEIRIKECKNKKSLPFDFSVLDKNNKILGLIEYQGEQHYKSIHCWSGGNGFESQKKRDKIKFDYCLENKIPLLIIPYWDFSNIELLLKDFLSKIQIFI